ncbi:hypothetical protein CRV15_22800 [Streptomyces clavuligerus]|uniref:Uncharacterized protein n=1 Tax=Streptomyces clavuligerus TaxID=1901 RepID=B5GYN7_STRCL|nr:hypothetical protein D1794_23435 [Streptomyces clavuligerus]EDY51433.1 hypothetical protein SSCG_04591 [Streptomyces clavuligerus]EFG06176.1 Hypothetical protein SCLAV_1097 [Streptomyces clavuligerus]QCS08189.1 hypothetical protein CRV15_22800 [Streptomyces clavuligerus]QPJ96584.1 hypothetical protein GE265_05305 [Streptomyces clavuligerus]
MGNGPAATGRPKGAGRPKGIGRPSGPTGAGGVPVSPQSGRQGHTTGHRISRGGAGAATAR